MNYSKNLAGQVAVVTGGSKGFGKGIASKLKENGVEVWITGRNEKELKAVADEINCNWFKADVASAENWEKLFGEVIKTHKRLDILVNNAGSGGIIADCDKQTPESITETITVNLTGSILGCRLAAGIMKKQKSGTIINISSVCAREAWPGWSIYSAAKAGIVQFGKSLYVELRPFGVRVTSVIPSWGATCFRQNADLPLLDQETGEKCIQPEEIGEQIASLCALPSHLCIQDLTLLPLVQEINPL